MKRALLTLVQFLCAIVGGGALGMVAVTWNNPIWQPIAAVLIAVVFMATAFILEEVKQKVN